MDTHENIQGERVTRRASLARAGGLFGALLAAGAWKAEQAAAAGVGPAGVASGAVSAC